MAGSRPATPASPKNWKPKSQEAGVPRFGCEHVRRLMIKSQDVTTSTIHHYKMLLRIIFDNNPIIPQTSKSPNHPPVTSITPNYLCLQCPATTSAKDRLQHGTLKSHMLYVDSRSGGLFCQMCNDFVWDPTLEELRVRKTGAGRKRKHDELFTEPVKEDPRYINTNTTAAPCRATGLRGIYNMGSTCFMSVILQSFVHNPLLRNFYLSDGHQAGNCVQEDCLSCGMDEIFQEFYAHDTTAGFCASNLLATVWATRKFLSGYDGLTGDVEHDAHEFFQFLAEKLHETETSQSRASDGAKLGNSCECIIHQTFYGKTQTNMTCTHCGATSVAVQPFLNLDLTIGGTAKKRIGKGKKGDKGGQKAAKQLTLYQCLDEEYRQSEDCARTCHSCYGHQECRKQTVIKRLPNVLCIQIKRFAINEETKIASKISANVRFPLQIDMLPYTNRARSQEARENFELTRSCTYDLLSVVVHLGSINTGHYVSYSRVGNQWFLFDDHKVTLATEPQVLGAEACLLFYIIRSLA